LILLICGDSWFLTSPALTLAARLRTRLGFRVFGVFRG
jgi:hypothetical protein